MKDILALIESASRDLASAKHHLLEAERQEAASVERMDKLRELALEHYSASAALRVRKEAFITPLCKAAYWMIGMKKYVLGKRSGVKNITLTGDEDVCIHLVRHPRNRCIVDHPRFLAGDEFNDAFLFFCYCLVKDVENFLQSGQVLAMQSAGLSNLSAHVSELKST